MEQDPLLTALLELDAALAPPIELTVGGGYGLFLKQLFLKENGHIQTLFAIDELPQARTTQDIDLILRAEVVTDSPSMGRIRRALDSLGFEVVPEAKYMQFTMDVGTGTVKIDLLAGPLGQFADRVPSDPRRVKPQPSVNLHARKLEEALAVEQHPIRIPISGTLRTGEAHKTIVSIPQAFTYLLTKLIAFRDRIDDSTKDYARHHALDIYRIVGLLTREEDVYVKELSREFRLHPTVLDARKIVQDYFIPADGIGRLRIREHQLAVGAMDMERFAQELNGFLSSL